MLLIDQIKHVVEFRVKQELIEVFIHPVRTMIYCAVGYIGLFEPIFPDDKCEPLDWSPRSFNLASLNRYY